MPHKGEAFTAWVKFHSSRMRFELNTRSYHEFETGIWVKTADEKGRGMEVFDKISN